MAIVDVLNGKVVEATWPKVRVTPLDAFAKAYTKLEYIDLPYELGKKVYEAACTKVGQGYDWTALIGFLVNLELGKKSKWFCSELVAWAFSAVGAPLFRENRVERIKPESLYEIHPDRFYIEVPK